MFLTKVILILTVTNNIIRNQFKNYIVEVGGRELEEMIGGGGFGNRGYETRQGYSEASRSVP